MRLHNGALVIRRAFKRVFLSPAVSAACNKINIFENAIEMTPSRARRLLLEMCRRFITAMSHID
jgi:hypothetical protein